MELLKMAYFGFLRYKKRRRNLTVVLIGTFFLIFFFSSFFATVFQNLWTYWVKDFIGGDIIINKDIHNYDIYSPAPPEKYIDLRHFSKYNGSISDKTSPHLRVGVLFENYTTNDSTPCMLIGIDLQKERNLNPYINLGEGRFFQKGKNEIILSETVASDIKAKLGDRIIIYVKTKDGYPNYDQVKIVGFLEPSSASSIFGQNTAFMPIDKLRELLQAEDYEASELLYVNRKPSLTGFKSAYTYKVVKGLSSFSFVRSLTLAFSYMAVIIFLLVFSFVLSSIYHNVVIMSAERTKEIGVFLTYGAKPGWIRRIFVLELVIYTLYCSLLGVIFSSLAIIGVNSLGIYPIDIATEILMASSQFIIKANVGTFFSTLFMLLFLVIIGGVCPIWKATSSMRVTGLFVK